MGKLLQKFYLIILSVISAATAVFCAVRFHASEQEKETVTDGTAVSDSAVPESEAQKDLDETENEVQDGRPGVVFAEESIQDEEEEPDETEDDAYEIIEISTLSSPGYYSCSFNDTNVNDNDGFRCLKLPVRQGEKYHLIASVYGWACLYKITDSSDNVIAVFDPEDNETAAYDEIITIPENGAGLCISFRSDSFAVMEKIQNGGAPDSASVSASGDTKCEYSYALSRTLCIGDSLTSGAYFRQPLPGKLEAGDSITQCYPYYLKRINNMETVTNAGVSGITVNGWLVFEMKKHSIEDYDSFIIWLGTNGGLSGSLEYDVNPFGKYSEYANTGVGNYCTIIEKIKESRPDAFIVLCTVFATESGIDPDTTNENIRAIGEKYGINVIDLSDLSFAEHPELHGNFNNIHFTKPGNIFIASRILDEINRIFSENPSLTEFGISKRKK